MSGPLGGGFFLTHTVYPRTPQKQSHNGPGLFYRFTRPTQDIVYLWNLLTQLTRREPISSMLTLSLLTPATEPVEGLSFINSPITDCSFRAINGRNFSHGTLNITSQKQLHI